MKTDSVCRLCAKDILLQRDAVRIAIKSEMECGQLSPLRLRLGCALVAILPSSAKSKIFHTEPPHRNQSIRYNSIRCQDIAHVQNRC